MRCFRLLTFGALGLALMTLAGCGEEASPPPPPPDPDAAAAAAAAQINPAKAPAPTRGTPPAGKAQGPARDPAMGPQG